MGKWSGSDGRVPLNGAFSQSTVFRMGGGEGEECHSIWNSSILNCLCLGFTEELGLFAFGFTNLPDCLFGLQELSSSEKMSGRHKQGGKARAKAKTHSSCARLQSPMGRMRRLLQKGNYAERIGTGAPMYLAAVLEKNCQVKLSTSRLETTSRRTY